MTWGQCTDAAPGLLVSSDLGYPYRVRADYIRGSDASNLSTDTGWQYFMVEK